MPNNSDLWREVLESEDISKVAGHMGQNKTLMIIWRKFFWPEIEDEINIYVRS
jgi:hypothetical protein